jgi:hypothetical protein
MTEIDIGKKLEEQEKKSLGKIEPEEVSEIKQSTYNTPPIYEEPTKSDGKKIMIMVGVLIALFLIFFGGSAIYNNYFTGAVVVDVDQLHKDNLLEELGDKEGYIYNGYSFVFADGLWWTEVNKLDGTLFKLPLHFGPRDVEEIMVTGTFDPTFNFGEYVYIAIDPSVQDKYYTLALSELSFNVAQSFDRTPQGACTKEHYACENRTILSCDNNPNKLPIIEFALSEENKVEIDNTCIKISGNDYGLTKAVDRLLFIWWRIMK